MPPSPGLFCFTFWDLVSAGVEDSDNDSNDLDHNNDLGPCAPHKSKSHKSPGDRQTQHRLPSRKKEMIVWEISRKRSSPESTIIIPAVLLVAKDVPVPQALIAFNNQLEVHLSKYSTVADVRGMAVSLAPLLWKMVIACCNTICSCWYGYKDQDEHLQIVLPANSALWVPRAKVEMLAETVRRPCNEIIIANVFCRYNCHHHKLI